jgi:hypothetical protein
MYYINFNSIVKLFLSLAIFFYANILFSQKEDNVWVSGYNALNKNKPDIGNEKMFGTVKLIFKNDSTSQSRVRYALNYFLTNSSICDSNGSLLFYTNGTKIFNKYDSLMQNGDSINEGNYIIQIDTSLRSGGYNLFQSSIIVKKPISGNIYYLFQTFLDYNKSVSSDFYISKLLVTTIDMNANNGLGKVIAKNETIIDGDFGSCISMCRHSNGEDWWLVIKEQHTNCFYKILINDLGYSTNISKDCEGSIAKPQDYHPNSCFSPDGKKYAYLSRKDGLYLFDFDRCYGKLSNHQNIHIADLQDSLFPFFGVSFSPNSRFIYVSSSYYIYQFDLDSSNIQKSEIRVGEYNEIIDTPWIIPAFFYSSQLAPNNKIYISTGSGTLFYHIIDSPDVKGKGCKFIQNGLRLMTFNGSLPNFPHFRLGKANDGCGADVIEVKVKNEKLKIFPNPASDIVSIDFGEYINNKIKIFITNTLGEIIFNKTEQIDARQLSFQTDKWSSGIYFVIVKDEDNNILLKSDLNVSH